MERYAELFEAMGESLYRSYTFALQSHARESVQSCRPCLDAPGVFCGDVSLGSAELELAYVWEIQSRSRSRGNTVISILAVKRVLECYFSINSCKFEITSR